MKNKWRFNMKIKFNKVMAIGISTMKTFFETRVWEMASIGKNCILMAVK